MEKRLKKYLAMLERLTGNGETSGPIDGEAIRRSREDLLVQIRFFQHERLVHLIVTVTFAILMVLSLLGCVFSPQPSLFALVILLLVLLVPYIRHYYILENGVQMLYVYYDNLGEILANSDYLSANYHMWEQPAFPGFSDKSDRKM